jgi:hypothetical protein
MRKRKTPKHKRATPEPINHDLKLLNSRAVLALANYIDYKITDDAHKSMERLFRDYKKHKPAVKSALVSALNFLIKERYEIDPDHPNEPVDVGPPPTKKRIKQAKKYVNQIAKKVWKN